MTNISPSPQTDGTNEEKIEALFNEQKLRNAQRRNSASTFSQFANSEANQDAGRFAAINKATVVGATPKPPEYAAPNWAPQAVGVEPQLGIDVNAMEPVGERFEVEASLERAEQEASAIPTDAEPVRGAAGSEAEISSDVEPPPTPTPTAKRRRL